MVLCLLASRSDGEPRVRLVAAQAAGASGAQSARTQRLLMELEREHAIQYILSAMAPSHLTTKQ